MGYYPYKPEPAKPLQGDGGKAVAGLTLGVVAVYEITPATSGSASILPMTPVSGSQILTSGFSQPDVPRVLNAIGSDAGTSGSVVVQGKDIADQTISDVLYVSGSASAGEGSKAFKSVLQITLPATSGSIAVGTTKKFGIPHLIESGSALVLKQVFDNQADSGTWAYSSGSLSANTYTPAGTPNGAKKLKLVYMVE